MAQKKSGKEANREFAEMAAIRKFAREWRTRHLKRVDKKRRFGIRAYKIATVYVGRDVAYLRLADVRIPKHSMFWMAQAIATEFQSYVTYYTEDDIHVYLRGTPRKEL